MSIFAIRAVRLNHDGTRVWRVRWQQVDGTTKQLIGAETESDANEVAQALEIGDIVKTIFEQDGQTVPGANVRYVELPHGHEGIETEDPERHPGRTLFDLPRF